MLTKSLLAFSRGSASALPQTSSTPGNATSLHHAGARVDADQPPLRSDQRERLARDQAGADADVEHLGASRKLRPLQRLVPVPAARAEGQHLFDAVVVSGRVVEDAPQVLLASRLRRRSRPAAAWWGRSTWAAAVDVLFLLITSIIARRRSLRPRRSGTRCLCHVGHARSNVGMLAQPPCACPETRMTTRTASPPAHLPSAQAGTRSSSSAVAPAGLELATTLGNTLGKRGKADITLVDRTRSHIWKPKLHEIAAGSMDMGIHEVDYLAQSHWHHFRYRVGEMTGLDRARREITVGAFIDDEGMQVTPQGRIAYDTLVMAVGSQSNDFGTPGVAEHALKLETRQTTRAASTSAWSTPASARRRKTGRCCRSSCRWRSSAPAPPVWSCRPNCTAPRAKWWPTGSIASTPNETSAST